MVPEGIADVTPWRDWAAAAEGVLRFLDEHLGWDVWMVTRVEGDHQIVLAARPEGVVRPGTRLPWTESFCHAMVEGTAPRVATVTAVVPEYASRTKGLSKDVAAYIGVPLVHPTAELFGTVCGFSFRAKPLSATRDLPLVEITARMLSTLLAAGMDPPPIPPPPD
ncbi:MAG TPA: histidine kinase [Blastococcus sp.]|jgi:GAF domain-containing protein|nr:histidine kinase [Blastococcus sp.]